MKYRLNYLLTIILLCCSLVCLSGCINNDDNNGPDPLTVPEMQDGVLTLRYPNFSVSYIYIQGGTPPYNVSCQSDILEVSMAKDSPNHFRYEVSDAGKATVTVNDAAGDKITVPVLIQYNETNLAIADRQVVVTGNNLTLAQHEELKEKALNYIPVKDGGMYRLIYKDKESGTLYVHKTAMDSYRYEGEFQVTSRDAEGIKNLSYTFKFENKIHTFYTDLFEPSPRVELTPTYGLYEDLTEHFLPDYPGLESLITIQVLKF